MALLRRAMTAYFYSLYRDMATRLLAAEAEIMAPAGGGVHLDLGSHAGENAVRLAAAAGVRPACGIDYDVDLLRDGLRGRGVSAVQADLNRPLPLCSAAFDVVTVMDVIEHLSRVDSFVAEVYRVLKPGGYAVIATPNLAAWHNVFALVLGLQPFSGPTATDMTDGELDLVRRLHRRAYDLPEEGDAPRPKAAETVHRHLVVLAYRSLVNLLERHGFRIDAARGYGYYPLPPFAARLAARLDIRHSVHLLIRVAKPLASGGER